MSYMFDHAASFKQPATLTRFGLVLPSPRVRTDTRERAVRPCRQPRQSRRALICSARAPRTAVLRYTRARADLWRAHSSASAASDARDSTAARTFVAHARMHCVASSRARARALHRACADHCAAGRALQFCIARA
jgi:hypothetical protein